jgi:hypothetical protein
VAGHARVYCEMKREDKIKKYAAEIQREIISCPNEQTFDEGDVIWIFGSCTDLADLLSNHDIPEELEEEVVAMLSCPECDATFEIWSEVGTKHHFEQEHEATVEQALLKHGEQLFNFYGFLHKNPLLGATHPFGKTILRELRKAPRFRLEKKDWFRARVDKEQGFGPAPAHKVADQRYNSSGQSRWYFADNAETAVAEVAPKGAAWVQRFDVGQLENLLDLRAWRADEDRVLDENCDYHAPHGLLVVSLIYGDLLTQRYHLGDFGETKTEDREWKPEYLVSRYVAEVANANGFAGILCRSARYPGENLTVFDSAWSPKSLGEPTFVALDESAIRIRENYFINQGEGMILPDI